MARLTAPRALTALALLAMLAASAALGAGSNRTKTVPIDSFSSGSVTARCSAGRTIVLGGFKANTSADVGLVAAADEPSSRSAWTAGATNTFVNSGQVTGIAYCGPRKRLKRVTKTVTVAAQSASNTPNAVATALCPKGMTVRSGGFDADVSPQVDGPGLLVTRMGLAGPRKWKVGASNFGPAPGQLRATALCGSGPKLRAADRKTLFTGGTSAATARCQSGKVVAGGFRVTEASDDGPYLRELSRPAAKRWRAGAFKFPGGGARVVAVAYCA
jgi:hypothetical protein